MAKKRGRSEKKTDWFGSSYIQHYDADGSKSGRSERKETLFGTKYVQHYDRNNKKTGRGEKKETIFGDQYTQKYDKRGQKNGTSERKRGLSGNYTQHKDRKGKKSDWSEERKDLFGNTYVQRYGETGERKPPHRSVYRHPTARSPADEFSSSHRGSDSSPKEAECTHTEQVDSLQSIKRLRLLPSFSIGLTWHERSTGAQVTRTFTIAIIEALRGWPKKPANMMKLLGNILKLG